MIKNDDGMTDELLLSDVILLIVFERASRDYNRSYTTGIERRKSTRRGLKEEKKDVEEGRSVCRSRGNMLERTTLFQYEPISLVSKTKPTGR